MTYFTFWIKLSSYIVSMYHKTHWYLLHTQALTTHLLLAQVPVCIIMPYTLAFTYFTRSQPLILSCTHAHTHDPGFKSDHRKTLCAASRDKDLIYCQQVCMCACMKAWVCESWRASVYTWLCIHIPLCDSVPQITLSSNSPEVCSVALGLPVPYTQTYTVE